MITVEVRDAENLKDGLAEVEIHCDIAGARELIQQLEFIISGESHVHLMTPEWAGNELSAEQQGDDTKLVHHLCIWRIGNR